MTFNEEIYRHRIADFLHRTARLLGSGVPLVSALEARLADARDDAAMIMVITRLVRLIEQGIPFTDACRRLGIFSEQILSAMNQAEEQGLLDQRLASLATLIDEGDLHLNNSFTNETLAEVEDSPIGPTLPEQIESLLTQAITMRASDMHIDPDRSGSKIRFRIDGMLSTQPRRLSKVEHDAAVSYLKIQANLDPGERTLPQDGRMKRTIKHNRESDQSSIDFRVSISPYFHGEKVVIRILESYRFLSGLDAIMSGDDLDTVLRWLRNPFGMVLVCGPTGCGKTTTLYLMLRELVKNDAANVISIEDPVEYLLEGVNQMMIKPRFGLTYEAALKAVLLQDPDVIAVGEVRGPEIAILITKVAMTGHLVLSQLHARDGRSAIDLLTEIGGEYHMLNQVLRGIVSQRLVRKLCPTCKQVLDENERSQVPEPYRSLPVPLYKNIGCPECSSLGYRGRIAFYEMFEPDRHFWEMLYQSKNIDQRRVAMPETLVPLIDKGRQLVSQGLTTWQEIERTAN